MAKRTYHQNEMDKLRQKKEVAERERHRQQIRATKQETARIKQKNDKKK